MIKIPHSFDLGPRTWDVIITDKIDSESEAFGHCDPIEATIHIEAGHPPQFERVTFWHELVHAIKFTMGEVEHDEKEVDALAQLLAQFDKTRRET